VIFAVNDEVVWRNRESRRETVGKVVKVTAATVTVQPDRGEQIVFRGKMRSLRKRTQLEIDAAWLTRRPIGALAWVTTGWGIAAPSIRTVERVPTDRVDELIADLRACRKWLAEGRAR
jgi:hypothetical protein